MTTFKIKKLIKKYREGKCTEEEKIIVDSWYDDLGIETTNVNDNEITEIVPRVWKKILSKIQVEVKAPLNNVFLFNNYFKYSAAACITILICLGLYFSIFLSENQNKKNLISQILQVNPQITVLNHNSYNQTVFLPDNSMVTLFPQSEIKYDRSQSGHERNVLLVGKAYFKVIRDTSKPFKVITKDITTTVLGTSFTVEAYPARNKSLVTVNTGQVKVSLNSHRNLNSQSIILKPNQQAIYLSSKNFLQKVLVENPLPINSQIMEYEESSVKNVFKALEDLYQIKIIYSENNLKNCSVSVYFKNETLFERLDIICKILGDSASYKVNETVIDIYSNGCKNIH